MRLRKILSLILVICMLGAMLTLTACKKDDDDTPSTNGGGDNNQTTDKTYTVTIVDGDNNPVEGVKLVMTNENSYPTATTGADGKASALFSEGTVSVMITTVPSGFVKPEKVSGIYHAVFPEGTTELTITLGKEVSNKVTYTVKVVDQNGDVVEGIDVQICYDGICAAAVPTDENGEITAELAPNTVVDVKLYELSGYTLPAANDHGYHAVISSDATEITVTITKN